MQIRRWLPDQPTLIGRHDWPDEGDEGTHLRLRAGSIVVLDRRAWRVLEVTGYPNDHWPEAYEKAWRDHMELWWHANELRRVNNQSVKPASDRGNFYKRPVVLVLRDENLPRSAPKHWCAPASLGWQVLPEHYAVCRACGELPPCHHGEYSPEAGPRVSEQSGGIPLIVPEGCCMGCAELIKPRMRTVRFPGPNLWYPDLGDDTAVFHSRSACEDQVALYRAQWQAKYPQPAVHPPTPAFPGFDHFFLPQPRHDAGPASALAPSHGHDLAHSHGQGHDLGHNQGHNHDHAPAQGQVQGQSQSQSPSHAHGQSTSPAHGQNPSPTHTPGTAPTHAPGASSTRTPGPSHAHGQGLVPVHGQGLVAEHGQGAVAAHSQEEARSSLVTGSGAFSPAFEDYRPEPDPYPSAPHPAHQAAHSAQAPQAAHSAHSAQAGPPAPAAGPAPAPAPAPTATPMAAPDAMPVVRAAEELSRSLTSPPVFHNAEQAARVIEELTAAVRNIALCLNSPQARSHPLS
ncbi:hypothetical protein ACF1CG_05815 [Streptomyces sp. NPDC014773]|uniref:hypothetical protein n=1 Tax=Streptomyces sp. NPDC014773 TaxID=3364908 RepID=UPI0037022892